MAGKTRQQPLNGRLTSKVNERFYKPLFILCVCTALITGFSSRYTLLPPVSEYACIPGKLFIMDKFDTDIGRRDLVTFKSKNTQLFPDETLFTKISAGVGGDVMDINRNVVVNGTTIYHTDVSVTADHLNVTLDSLSRKIEIPSGKLFALGSLPGSFDSRFWGTVDVDSQVLGKTYVIF